jgi:hypothetical protein
MTRWKSSWPQGPSSPCPPSRLRGMPMGHLTRTAVPMPTNSRSICPPARHGRRRAQSAARSAAGVCPSGHRCRQVLSGGGWRRPCGRSHAVRRAGSRANREGHPRTSATRGSPRARKGHACRRSPRAIVDASWALRLPVTDTAVRRRSWASSSRCWRPG